jgi:hypothetical protein
VKQSYALSGFKKLATFLTLSSYQRVLAVRRPALAELEAQRSYYTNAF